MKVSCLQENLAKGLNTVGRAVAARTATLPVLTHVLLATDGGRLKIAATNLELGINCWIGAKTVILKDVELGDGCVVGAGSVVTKSFPAGSVVVGVPARVRGGATGGS